MHFLAALQRERQVAHACSTLVLVLWILFIPRINLSPFTKDFRGEDHHNESIDQFLWSYHQIGRQPYAYYGSSRHAGSMQAGHHSRSSTLAGRFLVSSAS